MTDAGRRRYVCDCVIDWRDGAYACVEDQDTTRAISDQTFHDLGHNRHKGTAG
jgi:hypothetical protein